MKAPKLSRKSSKSASNDVSPNTSWNKLEPTLKTSLDELNHPSSREMLRQHFTGAFPETVVRKELQEWENSGSNMESNGQRLSRSTSSLTVGQNAAVTSSSSTIDTVGVGNTRLSTVQETQSTIDIAQAIQLLQELKKSASPQDLVALHKALLPTRDSIIASPPPMPVNEDGPSDTFTSQSVIRRGSMVPAGFATRGGASEDPLRRIEEMKATRKAGKSKARDSLGLRKKESKSSIAALDLADDTSSSKYARAATPVNEDYSPLGSYRPGTLRITNGAASPEPSIATRPSVELTTIEAPTLSLRESQDFATAPSTPLPRESHEYHQARSSLHQSMLAEDVQNPRNMFTRVQSEIAVPTSQEQRTPELPRQGRPRNVSISGIPHPEVRDESVPRIYKRTRPQRSREPSQTRTPQPRQRSTSATPHSRDASLSRIPIKVASRASFSGNADVVARKVSEQSLIAPIRRSIDDGRVSPMVEDIPRFAQRWSHRASQIEGVADGGGAAVPAGEQPASSYADKEALLNRLSTVYDREDDEATAHETPAAALFKLTGAERGQTPKQSSDNSPATATAETVTPYKRFPNNIRVGRPIPQKADSGYGTDGSSQEQQAKTSTEAGQTRLSNSMRIDADEGIVMEEEDSSRDMFSLREVLNSPESILPSAGASPRTPAAHKKHSSFLKLTNVIKGQSTTSLDMSSPALEETFSSPLEQRDGKGHKKKLQKPMPDSVKREFKQKRKKEKEEKAALAPILCEGFVTPDTPELSTPEVRPESFSWDPPTALPTPTAAAFGANVVRSSPAPLTAEAVGDMSFASPDEATATATSTPGVTRKRSKSLGRSRTPASPQIGSPSPQDNGQMQRSWSLKRKRPARRATDNGPARTSGLDVRGISCLTPHPDDGDDEAPMWTDHSSVSQTLGCNPYDISTTMFRRTVALPGMVTTTISSPHQITTAVSRTKMGGLQGMDSSMASELARMKSRDVAISNNEQVYERPRMATPKSRSEALLKTTERTARLPDGVVEPRIDARRSNVDAALGTPLQPVELSTRPMSTYAESIPPMPELPADVRRVIAKVDDMVAKRIRDEHRPSLPMDSTQPSPNSSGRSSEEKGCDSTISVADAVRKTLESRKKVDGKVAEDERPIGLRKRPSGPRQQSANSLQTRVHSVLRTKSSESIQIGLGSDVEAGESPAPTPSRVQQEEDMPSIWSRHAEVWKERRKSAGLSLGKPVRDDVVESPISPLSPSHMTAPSSPAIVVSRYITPHTKETSSQATSSADEAPTTTTTTPKPHPQQQRRRKSAADQADAYRALIGDDELIRTDSPAPLTTPTEPSSTLPTPFQPPSRARSPGGRVITPSGNFHPYTPADAATAENSRATSLAKRTAATRDRELGVRGTKSLDIARSDGGGGKRQRHQTLEQPRKSNDRSALPSCSSPGGSPKTNAETFSDRYSGGLEYGFERGVGVGGSAGTRGSGDGGAARKGEMWSKEWGVDLSDVPVFLTKV